MQDKYGLKMKVDSLRYVDLSEDEFHEKINKAKNLLSNCCLCPRQCNVNRYTGEYGICAAGAELEVAHYQLHFGEEPPLSGCGGAGTIFFPHCNLHCVYCQNYQISQQKERKHFITTNQLGSLMLKLQTQGAQNIDLVSPAHFVPMIIESIYIARNQGLNLPIIYNTNGYEAAQTLELLSGIIDVYLPDFRYANEQNALKYSEASDYVFFTKKAIKIMYHQRGNFVVDENGCARRGLIVRHLVLPSGLAESMAVLDFLKKTIGTNIGLSLMNQYAPCYRANEFEELNCTIELSGYDKIVHYAQELGFENCWIQEVESNSIYFPDFDRLEVF